MEDCLCRWLFGVMIEMEFLGMVGLVYLLVGWIGGWIL